MIDSFIWAPVITGIIFYLTVRLIRHDQDNETEFNITPWRWSFRRTPRKRE